MSCVHLFFFFSFDANPSQMCHFVLLQPVQLSDNQQLVCKKNRQTLSANLEKEVCFFSGHTKAVFGTCISSCGRAPQVILSNETRIYSTGVSEWTLRQVFFSFPLLGWPLAKAFGGRVSVCMDKTGKESAGT